MCSSTSAITVALATVGAPTVIWPSLLTSSTRSKVTGWPASTARRSICSLSPALTRYCLLPVSNTAYINFPDKRRVNRPENQASVNLVFLREATTNHRKDEKRHRAAALQNAGADSRTPVNPSGFGVRQPCAAFPRTLRRGRRFES